MKRSFFVFLFAAFASFALAQIDKISFYKALSGGQESAIDGALSRLESQKRSSQTNAYIGALTMKKAGFEKGVNSKVKTFKKGALLLEDEIRSHPENAEFRFLRLTVQEHAPKILKYNKQLEEDKQAVMAGYDKLDADLKSVIADYAKESKVLKEADLK